MAMIQCHECKRDISSTAEKCPHCGAPSKTAAKTAATMAALKSVEGCGCILTLLITVPVLILLTLGTCAK